MHRIISFLLILAGLGFGLVSCEQSPNSNTNSDSYDNLPMAAGGGSTAANPVIVYVRGSSVSVMDSDGTDQTSVYTASNTLGNANWSPSNSIAWSEFNGSNSTGIWNSYIRSEDISVNSSGTPVASNLSTVASLTNDTMRILSSAWSSTSVTNKIAFVLSNTFGHKGGSYVCRISSSGGTWDTLFSVPFRLNVGMKSLTWNADDSKLAVLIDSGSSWNSILIINTSSGAITDSINVSGDIISNIEWSRSSSTLNKLLFTKSDGKIYYLTPTSGSTASTNGVISNTNSGAVTWSPTNSSVMYSYAVNSPRVVEALQKVNAQATSTTTVQKSFALSWSMNWRR